MAGPRFISNRTSQHALSHSDYTWEYEYYEFEPVSFEGLKAHKYSIVIGFWVGLAVFVIFMFFVLTLLTKTGAPHQEGSQQLEMQRSPCLCLTQLKNGMITCMTTSLQQNADSSEKRFCTNNSVADFGRSLDSERTFTQQTAEESRLLFHCYIHEFENLDKAKQCHRAPVLDSTIHFQEVVQNSGRLEEELTCHTKFNIPNFVHTDQNSSLGEDDLLISEPPILLESKPVSQTSHQILD